MLVQSFIFKVCLGLGIAVGAVGVAYSTYVAVGGIGDGVCGASAFLFVFGLPTTLLEMMLGKIGLVKGTWVEFIALSMLFLVNWALLGALIGFLATTILEKNR